MPPKDTDSEKSNQPDLKWLDGRASKDDREKWKQAVLEHMNFSVIEKASHILFDVNFIKQMWGHICKVDPRWKTCRMQKYNSSGRSMERALYSAIDKKV